MHRQHSFTGIATSTAFSVLVTAAAAAILTVSSALFSPAVAQTSPRPTTLLQPYTAGGITDVTIRIVAREAEKILGHPIVVENRPGAGGKIALDATMRAAPDGYTVGMVNTSIAANLPLLDLSFKFDPQKDYTPIAMIAETYLLLAAHPSVPYRDMAGLLAYAAANPGKVNMASSGPGSAGHLTIELIKSVSKMNATHIPYKGEAPALNDLLGGQVPLMITSGSAKQHIDSGKLVGIAVTSPIKWDFFGNLPTLKDTLGAQVVTSSWMGVVGPPNMPPEVTMRLNRAFLGAMDSPTVQKQLADLGVVVRKASPQEFGTFIRSELDRWGVIVKAGNIKLN